MKNKTNIPNPLPPICSGWYYSKLSGSFHEIGYQHGFKHRYMISKILSGIKEYNFWATGITWNSLRDQIWDLWWHIIPKNYQDEMKGISAGVEEINPDIILKDIFLWNAYMEVLYYLCPTFQSKLAGLSNVLGNAKAPDSCSAFLAVGDYTSKGEIVMAHNSFTGFEMAHMNLILDVTTSENNRFVMQTAPGWIASNTDFGVNSNGLMITETTIGGFENYCKDFSALKNLMPEFIRARQAMEYARDFTEFCDFMLLKNTGGYANSWLVGNVHTNSIMRFELGYQFHHKEILNNGYFAGFNAPLDPRIRNLECSNTGYMDIRRHQGARQVRIPQLVEQYKGKITTDVAKDILGDHVDPYLSQKNNSECENPCARNIDAHYELDPREYMSQVGRPLPYQPQGAVDGKTMDSTMAFDLNFCVKWGSSGDIAFDKNDFFNKHPQFNDLEPYISDRPNEHWTDTKTISEKQ